MLDTAVDQRTDEQIKTLVDYRQKHDDESQTLTKEQEGLNEQLNEINIPSTL